MNDRPGCLSGLLKLAFIRWIYEGMQSRFGFGSGSCMGIGCGIILLILLVVISCMVFAGTDWLKLVYLPLQEWILV